MTQKSLMWNFPPVKTKSRRKKRNYKKLIVIIILFTVAFLPYRLVTVMAEQDQSELEKQLSDTTRDQLDGLNFQEFDEILAILNDSGKKIFSGNSFRDKIGSIINGEFRVGFNNIFSAVISLVFSEALAFLPYLFSVIAIAVLGSLLTQMRSGTASESTHSLINFVTLGAVIALIFVIITQLITITKNAVGNMQTQMNVSFPILLTLMTALGNINSAAAYQPIIATLANLITQLMINIVLPLFIFSVVFSVAGNLSPNVRLTKLADFFGSLSKWLLGIVFMLFMTFLTIQGAAAGTYDGISIKTAKYAISHYIPIIGGYLSEGLNIMLAGSMLIKNAVGVGGILLLVSAAIVPVIKIVIFSLGLKLCGAVLEPVSDSRISKFVTMISKQTSMLVAIILSVAFMYLLTLMMIIFTGNAIVYGS